MDDDEPVCVVVGCREPATAENLIGIILEAVDEDGFCWDVELVCERHRVMG